MIFLFKTGLFRGWDITQKGRGDKRIRLEKLVDARVGLACTKSEFASREVGLPACSISFAARMTIIHVCAAKQHSRAVNLVSCVGTSVSSAANSQYCAPFCRSRRF